MPLKILVRILVLVVLVFAGKHVVSKAEPLNIYSAPTQVTVQMYELDQNGSPVGPCSSGSVSWGCIAFCNNIDPSTGERWGECAPGSTRVYPYGSSSPTISIESDYLLDVISHEAFPSVFSDIAVEANAIAARSFTYGYIQVTSTIDNSTNKHVFVPYRFERLNLDSDPDNPSNVCASTNLNTAQQKVCDGLADRYYVSFGTAPNEDDPAITQYFSDIPNATIAGTAAYEVSVADPISSHPAVVQFGHGVGMSQNGASRWGHGNLGFRGDLDLWSIRWSEPEQILFHYYTGVHLRDVDNSNIRLSPDYRWNPLAIDWGNGATEPPENIQSGTTYNATIQLQNTGTIDWGSDVYLSCRWKKPDGTIVDCETSAGPIVLTKGIDTTVTLPVRLNTGLPNGIYTLMIDVKQGANFFHSREVDKPWPTLDHKVCDGGNCSEVYLPIIMKHWMGLKCDDYATTIWYPTGDNICDPSSISGCAHADGEPDGVYAGPFNLDQYHQVEFTPQLIRPETTIGTYWKKYSGDYAHLYTYIKVDDVWVTVHVNQYQGSGTPVWSWTNRGIGQYAGQYISGIRFKPKRANQIASMRLIIDGYRIRDFTYCTW